MPANKSGSLKESIARIELFTDAAADPADWRLVFHFETGLYDDAGKLLGPTAFGSSRVERGLGRIGDISAAGLSKTAGITQVVAWLQTVGQKLLDEDTAAAEAAAQQQERTDEKTE